MVRKNLDLNETNMDIPKNTISLEKRLTPFQIAQLNNHIKNMINVNEE
jgi:hypothetical protein